MIGQIAANYPDTLFNQIPRGIFNFGGGGVNAWRNICGGPNGGSALLAALGAPTSVKDTYMAWYESNSFPSNAAYDLYAAGGWTLTGAAVPKNKAPRAVPKSLLCHASHGRWIEAAGGTDGAWVQTQFAGNLGAAGSDRCAKLVYDCVFKLCELINAWKADPAAWPNTFNAGLLDPSTVTCLTSGCHGGAGAYDPEIIDCAPEVAGKMKCDESCHQ